MYNSLSFKLSHSNSSRVLNLCIQQKNVCELHDNNHVYIGA
jgi:hypothetical protein